MEITALSKKQQLTWQQGTCTDAHQMLGAHPLEMGMQFGVWAPNARHMHVVGDFNNWDNQAHPMTKDDATGIWQAVAPKARPGQCYKFRVTPESGSPFLKADPCGFYHQIDSHKASIIYPLQDFSWQDEQWLQQRQELQQPNRALSVYEVHLGSWKRKESGEMLSYTELANDLIPYVKKMGFTHIELMPVMEHPYDPSWGYQITGYFAPTCRHGTPHDFMAFVDACHQSGIGVILDWVPGHFPKDKHALAFFDGTALYGHEDSRRREHAEWGTHNFDFDKPGVRNFLLSNAFFWCEKYHVDGFRVDAVASMLYLDYSKSEGEWLPNIHGGNKNLGAISYLQDLNEKLHEHYPSVLTIAEESTAWPGVTRSAAEDGLGFNYKWNMGWMNDTLHYFEQAPENRRHQTHSITFPITYAFNEQFILPLSHDEVVHLKKSLWSKMPGTDTQRFNQLKLLYLYMMGFPGKKLLFMGSELAERKEWSEGRGLDWPLLKDQNHKNMQQFLSDLLHFYKTEPLLHATDHDWNGFEWTDLTNKDAGVFAFLRQQNDTNDKLFFVFNFSDQSFGQYGVGGNGHGFELLFDTLEEDKSNIDPGNFILKAYQGLCFSKKG